MNLYSLDIKICATAYIKAESEEEAARIVAEKLTDPEYGVGYELPEGDYAHMPVTGRQFDDPRLPVLSISPAVSIYGAWSEPLLFELQEEGIPTEDEDEEEEA